MVDIDKTDGDKMEEAERNNTDKTTRFDMDKDKGDKMEKKQQRHDRRSQTDTTRTRMTETKWKTMTGIKLMKLMETTCTKLTEIMRAKLFKIKDTNQTQLENMIHNLETLLLYISEKIFVLGIFEI